MLPILTRASNTHRTLLVAAGLMVAATAWAAGHAAPRPWPQPLHAMPVQALGEDCQAADLNDLGQVAGTSTSPQLNVSRAFVTGPNGRDAVDMGGPTGRSSRATAVNASGIVVGELYDRPEGGSQPFRADAQGREMTVFNTPVGSVGALVAINDSGLAAGYVIDGGLRFRQRAFTVAAGSTQLRPLGSLGGRRTDPTAINAAGQVIGAGTTELHTDVYRAFITDADGRGIRALDLPATDAGSSAIAINDQGQVLGGSSTFINKVLYTTRYFVTGPRASGIHWLPEQPRAVTLMPQSIDPRGRISGSMVVAPEGEEPRWTLLLTGPHAGVAYDVSAAIVNPPADMLLMFVLRRNAQGQLLVHAQDGLQRARCVLLCPTPGCEPAPAR